MTTFRSFQSRLQCDQNGPTERHIGGSTCAAGELSEFNAVDMAPVSKIGVDGGTAITGGTPTGKIAWRLAMTSGAKSKCKEHAEFSSSQEDLSSSFGNLAVIVTPLHG
jgi:hypothetical protein